MLLVPFDTLPSTRFSAHETRYSGDGASDSGFPSSVFSLNLFPLINMLVNFV